MASAVNLGTQQYFGFDPRFVQGCLLWLDGADTNTFTFNVGTNNVTSWRDKAFGSNATANTPIAYDSNGLGSGYPALTFTNTQWLLGNISITGTSLTVFSVFSMSSSSAFAARTVSLAAPGANDLDSVSYVGISRLSSSNMGAYRNGTHTPATTPYDTRLFNTTYFDGVNQYSSTNGGTLGSNASTGSLAITSYAIANNTNTADAGARFTGYIGEVLVYGRALTTAQRRQVEGYLGWKWGLQASLPIGSPYLSVRPIARTPIPSDFGPLLFWWDSASYSNISVSSGTVGYGGRVSSWNDRINNLALTVPSPYVGPTSTSNGISFVNTFHGYVDGVSQILHYSNAASPYSISQNATLIVAHAPNRFDNFRNMFWLQAPNAFNTNPSFVMVVECGASSGGLVGTYDGVSTWSNLIQPTGGIATTSNIGRVDSALLSKDGLNMWYNGNTYSSFVNNFSNGTSAGSASIQGMVIGGTPTIAGNREYDGTIYEILVYNDGLSPSAVRQVEGYLAWRWKFPNSLVATHSFRNLPSSTVV